MPFESSSPTNYVRRLWIAGWMIAVYALYSTVIGKDWFLPIYFAEGYLALFSGVLLIQRIEFANRYGTEELGTPLDFAILYIGGLACGFALTIFAPVIGEPNYCAARASSLRVPPTIFRCTLVPVEFLGFILWVWIAGWIIQAIRTRTAAE